MGGVAIESYHVAWRGLEVYCQLQDAKGITDTRLQSLPTIAYIAVCRLDL